MLYIFCSIPNKNEHANFNDFQDIQAIWEETQWRDRSGTAENARGKIKKHRDGARRTKKQKEKAGRSNA